MAVPQVLKDMPIPPDSDPRKTAAARSGSSQKECSRCRIADTAKFDVEAGEADEFRKHSTSNEEY